MAHEVCLWGWPLEGAVGDGPFLEGGGPWDVALMWNEEGGLGR